MTYELRNSKRIGLDAIIFSIYLALTPIHQVLLLSNGGTVTKYLAFATMITCVVVGGVKGTNNYMVRPLFGVAIWFVLSTIWSQSRGTTISSLISIISYFALFIIVCSKDWSEREKTLFKIAILLSGVYFASTLLRSASIMNRATIVRAGIDIEADQNVLSVNIALGALCGIYYFLNSRNRVFKYGALLSALMIVIGILATGSRGALIALFVSVLYLAKAYGYEDIHTKKVLKRIIAIGIILVIVVLSRNLLNNELINLRYSTSGLNISNRTEIWTRYFEILIHRPWAIIIGFGYGTSGITYANYYGNRWPPATHNDVISILIETGVVGIWFVYKLIKDVWIKGREDHNFLGNACFLLMLVASLSVNVFNRYGWWNGLILAYIGIGGKGVKYSADAPEGQK